MIQTNQIKKRKLVTQTKKFLVLEDLSKETNYNAKITEVEAKILGISGLATTAALTVVENKIPDISNLVKKTDYDAEILDIKPKYFTTAHYNRFRKEKLDLKNKTKTISQ